VAAPIALPSLQNLAVGNATTAAKGCQTADTSFMNLPPRTRRTKAFTFMELLIVIAVTGILLAAFLPALAKPRVYVNRIKCTDNLKQIGLSLKQWALDNGDKYPMQVSVTNGGAMELSASGNVCAIFLVMSNELNTPKILCCPKDNNRFAATNFNSLGNRNLGYFVGLDAKDTYPQTILSGDDNFTINGVKPQSGFVSLSTNDTAAWLPTRHGNQGNILLGDGSVQACSSTSLNAALRFSGSGTNRLLLP
jgi:prepilin-type N-terminal cleavage/methylation domain-containing protein/prepilin-type processing-associated H-X9-DG protein